MNKIFGAVLLSLAGFAAWFAVSPAQAQGTFPNGGAPRATIGHDPVQRCLDLVQLNVARTVAPAFRVTSRPVQNPAKDLPLQCVAGNLNEIKSALKNQITICEK
jgi:hypothetical protein